jgi:hypothetical protein
MARELLTWPFAVCLYSIPKHRSHSFPSSSRKQPLLYTDISFVVARWHIAVHRSCELRGPFDTTPMTICLSSVNGAGPLLERLVSSLPRIESPLTFVENGQLAHVSGAFSMQCRLSRTPVFAGASSDPMNELLQPRCAQYPHRWSGPPPD